MNDEAMQTYHEEVLKAAMYDLAGELAKAATKFRAGEMEVKEFLALVRESDDFATRLQEEI